jgi:hypothetical protein
MNFLQEVKKWLAEITEIALLLIALGITFEILFGFGENSVPFFGGVVNNITVLLNELGQNGLAGLIAMGIILYLFHRRRIYSTNQQQQ